MITIGMPAFNCAGTIERSIHSLLSQTFTNFSIQVADNASTDGTADIVSAIAATDHRIQLKRRDRNIGASANFVDLALRAEQRYFMWAAADDYWSNDYLAKCIDALQQNPAYGFASGGFCNVDTTGQQIRQIRVFERFGSLSRTIRLARFVAMNEASGKANMIYSVFRTALIKDICRNSEQSLTAWGGDMGLIAAALYRAPYVQVPNATLFKQISLPGEVEAARAMQAGRYCATQFAGAFPPAELAGFQRTLTRGIDAGFDRLLVTSILAARRGLTLRWQAGQKLRNLARRLYAAFHS